MEKVFAQLDRKFYKCRNYQAWRLFLMRAQNPTLSRFKEWVGCRPADGFSEWLLRKESNLSFASGHITRSLGMWVLDDGEGYRWAGSTSEVVKRWRRFLLTL